MKNGKRHAIAKQKLPLQLRKYIFYVICAKMFSPAEVRGQRTAGVQLW
jgi:hypothetical protein